MKKLGKCTIVFGLVLLAGACSSSTKTDADVDAISPPADASTDPVPQPAVENTTPPPAPTAATTTESSPPPAAGSGQFENYTIQSGDTLMKVAFQYYGDLYRWKDIFERNKSKLSDPNLLTVGTVISVEKPATDPAIDHNGTAYMIKQGDTLGKISSNVYGTQSKWRKLWENNKQLIHDPNHIFAGFTLYYAPDDGSTPPKEVAPQPMAGADTSQARMPASVVPPPPPAQSGDTAGSAPAVQQNATPPPPPANTDDGGSPPSVAE